MICSLFKLVKLIIGFGEKTLCEALRTGLKLRVKRRYIVALLSLLTLSAVMINTYSPFPSEQRGFPSERPHNNQPTEPETIVSMLGLHHPPSNIYSGAWKISEIKDSTKHTQHQYRENMVQKRIQPATKNKTKKMFIRQKQWILSVKNKHKLQPFTKHIRAHEPSNDIDFKYAFQFVQPRHDQIISQSASIHLNADFKPCRHKCNPDGLKQQGIMGNAQVRLSMELQQASGGTKVTARLSKLSGTSKVHGVLKSNNVIGQAAELRKHPTNSCDGLHDNHSNDVWNDTRAESLPWFSRDDVEKMNLLATGTVLSKARLPGHGQVLQVGLGGHRHNTTPLSGNHSRLCQKGQCALIKRNSDWAEVFAFHLDRVLGLNRSLPAVLRTFHSNLLPYKYTRSAGRPVVWWDPDIQHLADADNDQNSFSLTWPQYQALLKVRCGNEVALNSSMCVGVHHSEWGRLAMFDFLLQVNDRLDRYCCGFQPDSADMCVENLLNVRCSNFKDLMLVHILVRKTDPSTLVFIDNAGRPHQPQDNLNFRLIEGIDEFPKRAISVLQSGCLEQLLLHSLSVDKEFWKSQGGAAGLRATIRTIQQRARILLQRIQEKRLNLNL